MTQATTTLTRAGKASRYRTHFTRPLSGERVPVSVFAFPEVGPAGEIEGTIALIRDLRIDEVARAIHLAIETRRTVAGMFAEITRVLRSLVHFDEFRVVAVSRDREHLRTVFSTDGEADKGYPFRWWPIPGFIKDTIDSESIRTIDLVQMFSGPGFAEMAKNDPATRKYRQKGFRFSLSVPVVEQNQIVAFIGLDSLSEPYDARHCEVCERLPLSQAVLMSLHIEKESELSACFRLIRDMGANASNVRKVAGTLTEQLAQHFGWDYVAVFQRDETLDAFRAISQAGSRHAQAPSDSVIRGTPGIIARAFEDGVPVVDHSDARSAAGNAAEHKTIVPDMKSALALGIPGEPKRWVLHIESRYNTAFAREEMEVLQVLVADSGFILERSALLETSEAILNSVNDAVIETDRRGVIRAANPAARRLLDLPEERFGEARIDECVDDSELASAIRENRTFSPREVEIRAGNGQRVAVLLSGASLPAELGGQVFVAGDLSYAREAQRIEAFKEVFRNASLESRVPLTLAATWLANLADEAPQVAQIIDRVLEQLRKADLPLERLLRLATPNDALASATSLVLDLNQLVVDVLSEFPPAEAAAVTVVPGERPVVVRAPKDDIRFCVESALSFALRTRPQNRKLVVVVRADSERGSLTLHGDWTPNLGPQEAGGIRHRWRRQMRSDLALGSSEIAFILEQAGGAFVCEFEHSLGLSLRLPLAA